MLNGTIELGEADSQLELANKNLVRENCHDP
jgi:hypothetical protein